VVVIIFFLKKYGLRDGLRVVFEKVTRMLPIYKPHREQKEKKMDTHSIYILSGPVLSILSLVAIVSFSTLQFKKTKKYTTVSLLFLILAILLDTIKIGFDLSSVVLYVRNLRRIQFLFHTDIGEEMDRLLLHDDTATLSFPCSTYSQPAAIYLLDQMARYYRYIHSERYEKKDDGYNVVDHVYTQHDKQLSCLVLKSEEHNSIILLFKGTTSAFELQKDFDYVGIPVPTDWWSRTTSTITLHRGFVELYTEIRTRIQTWVSNASYVYVCGHSLGGALTNLCVFDIALNKPQLRGSIYGLTIGSPRVGNDSFASMIRLLNIRLDQIQNCSDIVCAFPTAWIISLTSNDSNMYKYMHAGSQYVCNHPGTNLGDAHSLSTYMQHVQENKLTYLQHSDSIYFCS
jgi:hypothetical protein